MKFRDCTSMNSTEHMVKVSAQPHTIAKQICFPNGNVLFLSLFSLFKNWMHNVGWGCAEIFTIYATHVHTGVLVSSNCQDSIWLHDHSSDASCKCDDYRFQRNEGTSINSGKFVISRHKQTSGCC